MAKGWHMSVDGAQLTLTRRSPARWDVAVQTVLTGCADRNRAAIAHQVRQDLWRALSRVRGFSPIVEVTRSGADMHLRAGGRLDAPAPDLKARIAGVLNHPAARARWCARA
jgi:hypothetical protein